jgi:hypothetical protein
MSEITLDAATTEVLKEAEPLATFRGPDGQQIGAFIPLHLVSALRRMLDRRKRAIDEACAGITLEKLKAIEAAGGEIPHEEVVRRLGLE